uniref:Uncharacterized protein n=1 Tax=Arundo donax TaxID=35708 RepID=A0A0A9G380_ARUDO
MFQPSVQLNLTLCFQFIELHVVYCQFIPHINIKCSTYFHMYLPI